MTVVMDQTLNITSHLLHPCNTQFDLVGLLFSLRVRVESIMYSRAKVKRKVFNLCSLSIRFWVFMHVLLDMKQHHGDEIHYLSFLFVYSWKMGEKLATIVQS